MALIRPCELSEKTNLSFEWFFENFEDMLQQLRHTNWIDGRFSYQVLGHKFTMQFLFLGEKHFGFCIQHSGNIQEPIFVIHFSNKIYSVKRSASYSMGSAVHRDFFFYKWGELQSNERMSVTKKNGDIILAEELPEGSVKMQCEIEVPMFKVNEAGSLVEDLKKEYSNQLEGTDWTLVCEGRELKCHSIILGARSPVFKRMLTQSGFVEHQTKQIKIDDMAFETLKALVKFMYTDSLDDNFEDVAELYVSANKYDLPKLQEMCEIRLAESLSIENALLIFQLSNLYQATQLKAKAVKLIKSNLKEITESSEWTEVEFDPCFDEVKNMIV